MVFNSLKKSKISLEDYDYKKDIENRILMATLSTFEVEVLEEILHGSITQPIKKLKTHFHTAEKSIISVLEKFSKTGLLKIKPDGNLVVNKKMRKYYETQFEKFDEDFKPDMSYLKSLLKKVPIHILPTWYSISRTSDDIFNSIVEKYLLIPKIYTRYLMEMNFDNQLIKKIMNDVFEAPKCKIRSYDLRKKYSLTREKFEEIMLLLEFNLICCLSYTRIGKEWKEVVTPFHEWREFLLFKREAKPKAIKKNAKIVRKRDEDFGFILDLNQMLKDAHKKPIKVSQKKNGLLYELSEDTMKAIIKKFKSAPELSKSNLDKYKDYFSELIEKLIGIKLAKITDGLLTPTKSTEKWEKLSIEQKVISIRRNPNNCPTTISLGTKKYTKRDIHSVETGLRNVSDMNWAYFEDFLKVFTMPVGNSPQVTLKKTGKKWRYELPKYCKQDVAFIKDVIFTRLFELGITAVGTCNGKNCFCLTSFGKTVLCL